MSAEGELVDDLLKEHASAVKELNEKVKTEIEGAGDVGTPTDDLFLLRFLLSNKMDVDVAAEKVRAALAFRKENIDLLRAAKNGYGHYILDTAAHFQTIDLIPQMVGCKPVTVARVAKCDAKTLMKTLSVDEAALALVAANEGNFQIVDEKTRSTGRIVKALTILDLAGMSLFQNDLKFNAAQAKSSKLSDSLYPQLLGKVVLLHMSSPLRWLINMVSKLVSKKTAEKLGTCPAGMSTTAGECSKCPFLAKFGVNSDHVPALLGGCNEKLPRKLYSMDERPGLYMWALDSSSKPTEEGRLKVAAEKGRVNCNVLVVSGEPITVTCTVGDNVVATHVVSSTDRAKQLLPANFKSEGILCVKCTVPQGESNVQLDLYQY